MSSISFPATNYVWKHVSNRVNNDFFEIHENEGCLASSAKRVGNAGVKTLAALAALIALIVTPFFALIDLFYNLCKQTASNNDPIEKETGVRKPIPRDANRPIISVLEFYVEGKRNERGVTLDEILLKDDDWLERDHNYIQWLFPTRALGVNQRAALTDDATIDYFRNQSRLPSTRMLEAFQRMIQFFGLDFDESRMIISVPERWNARMLNWIVTHPHNHRRVTRIIESLGLHGLEAYAIVFFKALETIYQSEEGKRHISQSTFNHWQRAYDRLEIH